MNWQSQGGATAVEYSLIVAAIAAVVVLVLNVLGAQTREGMCAGSAAMEHVGSQANDNC